MPEIGNAYEGKFKILKNKESNFGVFAWKGLKLISEREEINYTSENKK